MGRNRTRLTPHEQILGLGVLMTRRGSSCLRATAGAHPGRSNCTTASVAIQPIGIGGAPSVDHQKKTPLS